VTTIVILARTAYRSLNGIVTQLKNCQFGVNTTNELETIKPTNNNKEYKQQNTIKAKTLKEVSKY
jgi:hypothetical protein